MRLYFVLALVTNLLVALLLLPWHARTTTPPPQRQRPRRRRRRPAHPITRTTRLADGRLMTFDGWRNYHVIGVRFQIELLYRRLPKAGGEL